MKTRGKIFLVIAIFDLLVAGVALIETRFMVAGLWADLAVAPILTAAVLNRWLIPNRDHPSFRRWVVKR